MIQQECRKTSRIGHFTTILAISCSFFQVLVAGPLRAESALRLPRPLEFGVMPASTYDERGVRIGGGKVSIEQFEDGVVRMSVRNELGGEAHQVLISEMEPSPEGGQLRLTREQSTTFDEEGEIRGRMIIDHSTGVLRCYPRDDPPRTFPLPEEDRLILVPGNLLLRTLVEGESEKVSFQIASCHGIAGRHFIKVQGKLARPPRGRSVPDHHVARVEISADLGIVLNRLIGPLLPRTSFWFNSEDLRWLGHSSPTYTGGPTIILIRNETTAEGLLHSTYLTPAEPPLPSFEPY